jgi:tRNA U34 5-carboxymethylaminomethyl modifying GTPase MnmE/TrmE
LLLIEPGAEQRTQAYLNSSGLQDLRKSANTIVVHTKADLTKSSAKVNSQAVLVSASAKHNLTKLLDRIYDVAIDSPSQLDIQVITDRQFKVLDRLAQLLGDIQAGLRQQHPRDVLLTVLQQCIEVVSELDGSSASEAVITEIFRNFCIGK